MAPSTPTTETALYPEQLTGGALLIELLFWNFSKVPFTCSCFPGKMNPALLALCWRRHPAAAAVRFDGSEPDFQILDLT